MMMKNKPRPTLDRPETYRIRVPGALNENWLDWNGGMSISIESDGSGNPITTLTITLDQAGLQGLLRHLYSLGLSLISVHCVGCEEDE